MLLTIPVDPRISGPRVSGRSDYPASVASPDTHAQIVNSN